MTKLLAMMVFALSAGLVSWLVINYVAAVFRRKIATAPAQLHHTHEGYVPRVGGVGIAAGLIVALCATIFVSTITGASIQMYWIISVGALMAFGLGLADDFYPIGAKMKLLVQFAIAFGAYTLGLQIEHLGVPGTGIVLKNPVLMLFISVFWFVAMMNLINLIDGLDGLAGGIALMLMCLLAYVNFATMASVGPVFCIAIAGAIIGFLIHNFPPAKVYMGDSGAYMLGFLIAALAIISSDKGTVAAALVAPILALALPIADVSFAIVRRGLAGLPIFRPDRHHIHHRLLRSGLSTRRTVIILYSITLVALIFALLNFAAQGRVIALLAGFAFVIILFVFRGQKIIFGESGTVNELREGLGFRWDARNALHLKNWLVVESERADSGLNLWQDYKFVLKKMGFCRASLTLGMETRTFYVPNTTHADLDALFYQTHTIEGEYPVEIVLYAEKQHLSERQFNLLADLAVETWHAAASKWKTVNGQDISFKATAIESITYRQQRNRALYRPTY
jgi:UDP-GlcNAc:undecaprenyl-phosphate GlcNAc-1-phosphate transferase